MKIGFNLLVLGGHITDAHARELEMLSKLGYDGVEIPILEGEADHYRDLARRCADLGLARTAVTVMTEDVSPCSLDPAIRAAAKDRLKWVVDNAEALGADVICGPIYAPLGLFTGQGPTEPELDHAADTLRAGAEHAAKAGVTLVMEPLNRFETYLLNTDAQAADLSRRVGHPNLGFMHDTFHANIEESDPVGAFKSFATQFSHIHISENDRGVPGRGHAAIAETIAAARASGYDRWMVVEAFGRAVPELAAATRVWRDLFPSLEVLFGESIAHIRRHWDPEAVR